MTCARPLLLIALLCLITGSGSAQDNSDQIQTELESIEKDIENDLDNVDAQIIRLRDQMESGMNLLQKNIEAVADSLDRNDGSLRSEITSVQDSVEILQRAFNRFDEKYQELDALMLSAQDLIDEVQEIETSVVQASVIATNAQATSSSVRWIVAIGAFFISALTVVFGLIFSQRFINLNSDARTATALLQELQKKVDKMDAAPAEDLSTDMMRRLSEWLDRQERTPPAGA